MLEKFSSEKKKENEIIQFIFEIYFWKNISVCIQIAILI